MINCFSRIVSKSNFDREFSPKLYRHIKYFHSGLSCVRMRSGFRNCGKGVQVYEAGGLEATSGSKAMPW